MTKKELVDNLKALGYKQANSTARNTKRGHYRAYLRADRSFLIQCLEVPRSVLLMACLDLGFTLVEKRGESNFIIKN
jgi:hypothetical protein